MPVSLFSGCTETCGWIAAIISVLAFGTFGVPLKTSGKPGISVHPLVLQSYKTFTCFTTCWLVLLLGEKVQFSWYGILSGLFWVPGAACGIYGIRNAGLAIAVGTWSAITVLTSFVFGIIIFQEKVKNLYWTILAFLLLICGLVGMAQYSSAPKPSLSRSNSPSRLGRPCTPPKKRGTTRSHSAGRTSIGGISMPGGRTSGSMAPAKTNRPMFDDAGLDSSYNSSDGAEKRIQPLEMEALVDVEDKIMKGYTIDIVATIGGINLTRRETGILGAVINGAWGGLNLIPLHYATQADPNLSGAGYLISYGIGSMIVNCAIWIVWLLFEYYRHEDWQDALDALPSFHFDHLLGPGVSAGVLYSIGNFGSIIAVAYLGQGTGFSFCMMQLFVSGLWGVFFFKEIRGFETITKWFVSAAVAVTGIILLSYQHDGSSMGHR